MEALEETVMEALEEEEEEIGQTVEREGSEVGLEALSLALKRPAMRIPAPGCQPVL